MSMGMIRLDRVGMGTAALTSFNDQIPTGTAAGEATRAASVAEQAKKYAAAGNLSAAEQLTREANAILANANNLARLESRSKTGEASILPVVEVGADAGKIWGMDSKTFMLVAAAGLVLVMMEQK